MYRFLIVRWIAFLAIPLALVVAACQPIQAPPPEAVPEVVSGSVSPSDPVEAQIANAMSAAPDVVGHDAMILGWDEGGMPKMALWVGAHGWTYMINWPASPGNEP